MKHVWFNVAWIMVLAVCRFSQQGTAADAARSFIYVCRDAGVGGYQAFPDACRLRDGRLMCVFYASYHHIGLPCPQHPKGGRIAYCTSSDEGHSWGKPQTLYDGPDDERDLSIVQLKHGRLLCNFFVLHRKAPSSQPIPDPFVEPYTELGAWIVTSDDLGKTWSAPRQIYDSYECSSPVRELSDGRLVMPLYGRLEHGGYLFRTEKGHTIVLAYRAYNTLNGSGAGFTGLRYSCDECRTWSEPVTVDTCVGAYPSVVNLKDGSVLIVYYDEGGRSSIRAKRFRVTPIGVEWLAP